MTNAWQVTVDASYNTVLSEFSIPSGKLQDCVQIYNEEEEEVMSGDEVL
jgi:hypothetical protein